MYLIYNVVLISAVQHSDSVIHIYTFFFTLFSIMVYPRLLNIVPLLIFQNTLFVFLVLRVLCITWTQVHDEISIMQIFSPSL